jgi:glutamyl-tRNA synthetase
MPSSPDPRTTTATGADVRVRFCPSPTGLPHVGLVRTALYNWAYARHTGGKLIFRVEDTDAARDSEESYRQLIDALTWLEIDWDEGVEKGGPHAPYRQSQRSAVYAEVLDRLIAAGAVYESYSTAEEIDARNEAAGRAKQLGYDNYDRGLTDEQKAAFRAEGREPAWRVRVPDEDVTYVDLIRGEVTFPAGSFPDFVIVRAGGQPLYTFTNPVDDALMGITHVIRGEDLMPSTARQLALYSALIDAGVAEFVPRFAHMPLVLGETGNKKLSKRDPQADLFLQREKGFIHEGLLNYLALLGWSLAPDRDVFSLEGSRPRSTSRT